MKVEVTLNPNIACASRGTENDIPNTTEEVIVDDYSDLADWLEDFLGILVDAEAIERGISMDDIIEACNDVDVTGGDTVVFWIDVDGKRYETQWADDYDQWDFEEDEEDEDDYLDEWGYDLDDPNEFTMSAVTRAFEGIDSAAIKVIAKWYVAEGACEDFEMGDSEGADEFASYIKGDIEDMLDAADEDSKKEMVVRELQKHNYIDPDITKEEDDE